MMDYKSIEEKDKPYYELIAARALKLYEEIRINDKAILIIMDLNAADKKFGLDFPKLFECNDTDFAHDVLGIRRNSINKDNDFIPKCCKVQ